jgi:hypothetical protein
LDELAPTPGTIVETSVGWVFEFSKNLCFWFKYIIESKNLQFEFIEKNSESKNHQFQFFNLKRKELVIFMKELLKN